jgi:two-component system, chemotaxis family, chemotaxis protein CheY
MELDTSTAAPQHLKPRAIVIDDSHTMRMILRRSLESWSFDVVESENGRQALERLARMRIPELALVDWNMPEMNGIDFILAVRRDRVYDAMRIMMITTETEFSQVERALRAGANEYVMKPFSKEVLADKLCLLGFRTQA